MADSFIGAEEPASVTHKIDTESLTVGANTVERQRVEVAGATATDIAAVTAANGLDVDVTRVIPGTSATHLGKAIDTAAGATDTGVALLAVRDDALATLTPADGDYVPLRTDDSGRLHTTSTLAAGSASIGVLGENDGVDIGNVDVTSIIPGTNATNLGKAEDAAHTSGDVGVQMLAVRTDSPANRSTTDGDYEPPQVSGGLLWTRVRGVQTPNGDSVLNDTADAVKVLMVDSTGATITAGSEYTEGDTDATISGIAIMWEDTSDTLRVPSASKPLPVEAIALTPGVSAAHLGKAEDAVHGSGDTGVMALARRLDTPTNSAGNSGDYCTLDVNAEGGLWTSPVAAVGGGCEAFLSYDLDETEEDVKTSAGTLFGGLVTNTAETTRFIKIYNATAANVTVGTTTPKIVVGIPGNATDDIAAVLNLPACGVKFGTAISVAATTDLLDDGSPGAPAANDVAITLFYK